MWRPTTRPNRTRRGARAVAALAATAALFAVPAASGTGAATAAPYCGITWGSLAKTSAPLAVGRVDGVRAGRHACCDRLVLDMTGPAPGFAVCYVTTVLNQEAGFAVPVAGGARLAVVAHKGATTVPTMPSVAGFTTFRQVKWAGSSNSYGGWSSTRTDGWTTLALGVRARLPHRVFTLYDASTNRSRLVVDVAHRW
jgi:hypothetical protein